MDVLARIKAAWRAFEGAQSSPQHLRRPIGSQQSPDAALDQAGTSLSEWGTYLDENHDLSIGVIDDLVTNIVGTGIRIEPRPVIGGRVNTDLADQIHEAFTNWARAPEVTGELPWTEVQRVVARSWLRDGECFVQHVGDTPSYPYGERDIRYRIEYLEHAMVPMDTFRSNPDARHGVIHNQWNQPVAYLVYLQHPHDYQAGNLAGGMSGNLLRTKTVPAQFILHVKFARRWPQTRGVPITHGIIRRLQDLKDYEDSERIAARVAASMCAYIRKSPENNYEPADDFDNRPARMQSGRIFDDLMPGEEIGTISVDRPNAGLQDFRNSMLRAVAAGTGTRYSSIAKDYSGTYSSQRQELVEARPHYLRLRDLYVQKFIRPVYERWLQQASLQRGVLPGIPAGTRFEDLRKAEFIGPGLPWIDPLKEIQADALAIEKNLITREQVIINRGGDPRDVPEVEPQEPATVLEVITDDEEDDQGNAAEQA